MAITNKICIIKCQCLVKFSSFLKSLPKMLNQRMSNVIIHHILTGNIYRGPCCCSYYCYCCFTLSVKMTFDVPAKTKTVRNVLPRSTLILCLSHLSAVKCSIGVCVCVSVCPCVCRAF